MSESEIIYMKLKETTPQEGRNDISTYRIYNKEKEIGWVATQIIVTPMGENHVAWILCYVPQVSNIRNWIKKELIKRGWDVQYQVFMNFDRNDEE